MGLFTKLTTLEELKQIFVETLFNKTSKVTKISDNSVLNGIAYGVAKVGQKALKDIALSESHLYPEVATGAQLDLLAQRRGIMSRLGNSQSSTYLRVYGDVGTFYATANHHPTSTKGIIFEFDNDFTIGALGYEYVKIKSQTTGKDTNVEPLTITKLDNEPSGHQYLINEFKAIGGRDIEGDDLFRVRIMEGPNTLATDTLSYLTQICKKFNSDVGRVIYQGHNDIGKIKMQILTQNGISLTTMELENLLNNVKPYLPLNLLKPYSQDYVGIFFENVYWFPIDIDFRVNIDTNYDLDLVRKNIQTQLVKSIDYNFWEEWRKVEWDNLINIIKNVPGVIYVPDQYFLPNKDLKPTMGYFPRFRNFIMRDLDGNVIIDLNGNLNPYYLPSYNY